MVFREGIYTKVTVCLDVFSDVLIISVPIALLWNVKISLRRKLELGGVLCLSLFMIAIAIVRVALAELPEGITDTTWLVFWQGIESCVAIITVSIVAFRSLLSPQGSKASKTTPPHERETPNLNSTYGKYSPAGTTPSVTDTWVGSVAYEELEPAKPVARPRQWLPAPVELPPIELPFLNNTDHLDDVSSDDEYDERESSRNEVSPI